MKKVLAVLLAVVMLFSVMAVGFVVFAEGGDTTVSDQAQPSESNPDEKKNDMPDWLTNLINRLTFVLTKVLAKLGIKLALKTGAFA